MIRTVWLAMICLAVVSALTAGKALRTSTDLTVAELSADATSVGIAHAQDTLAKADRLEITFVRPETPPQPAVQSTESIVPAINPPEPPMEAKIISRHWRDPNAFPSSLNNSKQSKQDGTNKKNRMSIANAAKLRIDPNRLTR